LADHVVAPPHEVPVLVSVSVSVAVAVPVPPLTRVSVM
jgi:hypothetical protein